MKTITEAAALIKDGQLSPVEATKEMLSRIDTLDLRLNSYLSVWGDRAIERAKAAEKEIAGGNYRGPMHGIPIAVKDLVETAGKRTTAGSKVLRDWIPDRDATVVRLLEEAGAVILGKLNMTEFAMGWYHPDMPVPINPWAQDRWAGASSSGTGAAVAAGLCMAGIGSDTGGSIRLPSAACGVTGIKPTFGVVSRHGVFPLANSLDTVGPMARSVEDAAIFLDAIAGFDPNDPNSVPGLAGDYRSGVGREVKGLRVGVDGNYITKDVEPAVSEAVLAAIDVLGQLGAELIDVEVPILEGERETWNIVVSVDTLDAHRDLFREHAADYGPFTELLLDALNTRPEDYARARDRGQQFAGRLRRVYESVDVIACPSMPMLPWQVNGASAGTLPTEFPWWRFTIPFNFSRNPTISVPCGISAEGLPHSLQLVGRHFQEQTIIALAHAFEQATEWHTKHPPNLDMD
jgi:amidase